VEVYGTVGAVFADNRHDLRIRIPTGYDTFTEKSMKLPERSTPLDDPFSYLKAIIRGKVAPSPHDLSSLENNLIVMEILEAAKKSAATGKRIPLNE
jgi:predicted dehydrogenase